ELHHEIAGKVLWLNLTALLAPQTHEGRFIAAHDDPGVRPADERAAIRSGSHYRQRLDRFSRHDTTRLSFAYQLLQLIGRRVPIFDQLGQVVKRYQIGKTLLNA